MKQVMPPSNWQMNYLKPIACIVCGLFLCCLLATGCRSVRRGEPFTGPFETGNPQVARGQLVFMKNCHRCHPGGEGGLGPGLNYPLPTLAMRSQVRLGLGVMPGFDREQISPEELDDLMAYLVALRRQPFVQNPTR